MRPTRRRPRVSSRAPSFNAALTAASSGPRLATRPLDARCLIIRHFSAAGSCATERARRPGRHVRPPPLLRRRLHRPHVRHTSTAPLSVRRLKSGACFGPTHVINLSSRFSRRCWSPLARHIGRLMSAGGDRRGPCASLSSKSHPVRPCTARRRACQWLFISARVSSTVRG